MEREDTYFLIYGWMSKLFEKQYAKRDVFAVVYGFSRDGKTKWHGSLDTMAEITGHAKQRCSIYLNELANEGYLIKEVHKEGNAYSVNFKKIKECTEQLTRSEHPVNQMLTGGLTRSEQPVNQMLTNNNIYNNINNNITNSNEFVETKKAVKVINGTGYDEDGKVVYSF